MSKYLKVLVVSVSSIILGFGFVASAQAHTDLVSTTPSADAVVNAPLDKIALTFSEPPLLEGSAITVSNQDGSSVDTEALELEGSTLSIPWPTDIAVGDVTVNYRVASDDGHVVDGTLLFTYTAAAVSVSPSDMPSTDVTALASEMPTLIATPMPMAIDDEELGEQAESKTWIYVGVGAFIVIAGSLLFFRRKK